MPRALLDALVLVLALTAALAAHATQGAPGSVRGSVVVRSPVAAPTGDLLGGTSVPRAPRHHREAVVFFETPPDRVDGLVEARVAMRQRDATFLPHVLAVTAGTTVEFPNDDETYHNVFSLSKPRPFDLGRYAAGRSKAVRFERPGIVRVFCDIHTQMNAFIHVFDHRFHAVTDAEGRYEIDRVPPGTYRVTAWYEGVAQETKVVTVAPGAAAELNFALR